MATSRTSFSIPFVKSVLLFSLATPGLLLADTFTTSFLPAGVQVPSGTSNYETFDSVSSGASSIVTNFNGSTYTGTYTGDITVAGANVYGGAGGTGKYLQALTSTGFTLTLSSTANYFGLWFSALDAGNNLAFYNNSQLVYNFTPSAFISLVGACPASAFCGNPNGGGDSSEQFAYLNFYDSDGAFNRIVFTSSIAGNGFESDNHAVALLNTPPAGTPIPTVPEPAAYGYAFVGLSLMTFLGLRKRKLR